MNQNVSSKKRKVASIWDVDEARSYLNRIGATRRSMMTAVVGYQSGNYFKDVASTNINRLGDIECKSLDHMPTDEERTNIKKAFENVQLPEHVPTFAVEGKGSEPIKEAEPENVYIFYDDDDRIPLVQVAHYKDGIKTGVVPYIYCDDGQWHNQEPEGLLPLFNAHRLKGAHVAFLHEGAKAARFVQDMVDAKTPETRKLLAEHPWGRELSHAAHLGWIGGAHAPKRTDLTPFRKHGTRLIYIVSDNDKAGRRAVRKLSKRLAKWDIEVRAIYFDDRFKVGADLADPFPQSMYTEIDGHRIYTGLSFMDAMRPATWLTKQDGVNRWGNPIYKLREIDHGWVPVLNEGNPVYVHMSNRRKHYSEAAANKVMQFTSDSSKTVNLIDADNSNPIDQLSYEPGGEPIEYIDGERTLNGWMPSSIRPVKGDTKPWDDFLENLITDKGDRHEVERWVATAIARQRIRMSYGLILTSKQTGTGKSTLGVILVRILGLDNCSICSASEVENRNYNDWIADKKLIVINEIYAGMSWKLVNYLKDLITEPFINITKKYVTARRARLKALFFVSSNSLVPMPMEEDDRRWFWPEVTETKMPVAEARKFYDWLNAGGLSIIAQWAEDFVKDPKNIVQIGERAPMSARKREAIEDSQSAAEGLVADLARAAKENIGITFDEQGDAVDDPATRDDEPWCVALADNAVSQWLDELLPHSEYRPKPRIIRGWFKAHGFKEIEQRVKVDGSRYARVCYFLRQGKELPKIDDLKKDNMKSPFIFIKKPERPL